MLVVFKSAPILKRTLKVKHATLQVWILAPFFFSFETRVLHSFGIMHQLFEADKFLKDGKCRPTSVFDFVMSFFFHFSFMFWSCWRCRPSISGGSGGSPTWRRWAPSTQKFDTGSTTTGRTATVSPMNCFFAPLPYKQPTYPCQIYVISYFRTNLLSRLGLGNWLAGSTADHL